MGEYNKKRGLVLGDLAEALAFVVFLPLREGVSDAALIEARDAGEYAAAALLELLESGGGVG